MLVQARNTLPRRRSTQNGKPMNLRDCPTHGKHATASCPRCDEALRAGRPITTTIAWTEPPTATPGAAVPALTSGRKPKQARFSVTGAPVGKPRMTQRDKWQKRPAVMRYREWADRARETAGELPQNPGTLNWTAYLPIPKSWSKVKRSVAAGQPHRQKPDRDNIDKAVLDSLFKQDSGIHTGTIKKLWDDGNGPRIEIEIL